MNKNVHPPSLLFDSLLLINDQKRLQTAECSKMPWWKKMKNAFYFMLKGLLVLASGPQLYSVSDTGVFLWILKKFKSTFGRFLLYTVILRVLHQDREAVALQLYWNHTSAWVFSSKFAVYFQNTSGWLLLKIPSFQQRFKWSFSFL